jgi:hypothetical protein
MRWTGVAKTWESIGTESCNVAIFIAELEKCESERRGKSMGGRFIDPKIVIASRRRKVAAIVLGTFVACLRDLCVVVAAAFAIKGTAEIVFAAVGCPYVWTNRTSFHTPSGTLTTHVDKKVIELTRTWSAFDVTAFATLSTEFAVVYVAA